VLGDHAAGGVGRNARVDGAQLNGPRDGDVAAGEDLGAAQTRG